MKHLITYFIFIIIIAVCFSTAANTADAQGRGNGQAEVTQRKTECNGQICFIPLVGIPYINTQDSTMSLPKYVNALYLASISIAAFLAVIKIIFAGVQYMLSDVVTDKGQAKKDIRGALIGLLIVIGAVLILNTINPQLSGLRALDGPPVSIDLIVKEDKNCADCIVIVRSKSEMTAEALEQFKTSCNSDRGSFSEVENTFNIQCKYPKGATPGGTDNVQVDTAIAEATKTGEPVYTDTTESVPIVCTDSGRDRCIRKCSEASGFFKPVSRDPLIAVCEISSL